MSEKRPQRREKWAASFISNIINDISDVGRPLTVAEVYAIYKKFGKKLWSAEFIEKLINIAVSTNEIITIDLKLPDGKCLSIFPKRHRISSTVFFALASEDINKSTELAESELLRLVNIAEGKGGNKSSVESTDDENIKLPKNKVYKEILKDEEGFLTKKKAMKLPDIKRQKNKYMFKYFGYIPQKMVRCQILHSFILHNFRDKTFKLRDIVDNLPISLFCKLVGVYQLPVEFYMEPNLRHFQFKMFPLRIQNYFNISDAGKAISKLLDILISYSVVSKHQKKMNLLYSVVKLEFENGPLKIIDFRKMEDVLYFWRFILISSCPTKASPLTEALWKKEWSLSRASDFASDSDYIISLIKGKAVNYENIAEIIGIEREKIKEKLDEKEIPADLSFFSKTNTLITNETFDPNKIQLISLMTKEDIPTQNFMSSFYFCTAAGFVTVNGVECPSFIPWSLITNLMNEIYGFNEEDYNQRYYCSLHFNSMWFNEKYRENIKDSIAFAIAGARKLPIGEKSEDFYDLQLSEIESVYSINRMVLRVSKDVGELIEGLKRRFLESVSYYSAKAGYKFLSSFNWNLANESLTVLGLLNYIKMTERKNIGDLPVFVRNRNYSKGIHRNKEFYEEIQYINKKLRELTHKSNRDFNEILTAGLILHIFNNISGNPMFSAVYKEDKFSKFKEIDQNFELVKVITNRLMLPIVDVDVTVNAKEEEYAECPKSVPDILMDSCIKINTLLQYLNKSDLFEKTYFVFSFITQSMESGISFDALLKDATVITTNVEQVCKIIDFLIEYDFVSRISCCSAMPYFICNNFLTKYSRVSRVGHIFTDINGDISLKIAQDTTRVVFNFIQCNRGCTVSDIQRHNPHLSLADIFHVIEALEADEAVFCQESIEEESLFESKSIPCVPSNPISACYNIWREETDKDFENNIVRRYFATIESELNLSFLGDY